MSDNSGDNLTEVLDNILIEESVERDTTNFKSEVDKFDPMASFDPKTGRVNPSEGKTS